MHAGVTPLSNALAKSAVATSQRVYEALRAHYTSPSYVTLVGLTRTRKEDRAESRSFAAFLDASFSSPTPGSTSPDSPLIATVGTA
jgi:hypothetical protein